MKRLFPLAFATAGVFLCCIGGCCNRNDVFCYRGYHVNVQAASGNTFPMGASYAMHWEAAKASGVVESFNDDKFMFVYAPNELVFNILTDSDLKNVIDIELYIDGVLIGESQSIATTRKDDTTCNNRSGPAWCDDEPIPNAYGTLILDESSW